VKIRQQQVDDFELITGRNKNIGFAGEGLNDPRRGSRAFEQTKRGGANSNHPPARRASRVDFVDGFLRERSPLGVHLVVFGMIHFHGQKGSGADVQRHRFKIYAPFFQPLEKFFGKM